MPRHKIYFPHFVKLNHNSFSESWQFESLPWLQLCGAALLSLGELEVDIKHPKYLWQGQ